MKQNRDKPMSPHVSVSPELSVETSGSDEKKLKEFENKAKQTKHINHVSCVLCFFFVSLCCMNELLFFEMLCFFFLVYKIRH